MTEPQNKKKIEEIRQIREAQTAQAMEFLTAKLAELTDPEAVVLAVLNGFFDLPAEQHASLMSTLALKRSKRQ